MEVYKNGSLVATRDVSSWPYYDVSGYIGLWMMDASDMVLDDFGGGTMPGNSGAVPPEFGDKTAKLHTMRGKKVLAAYNLVPTGHVGSRPRPVGMLKPAFTLSRDTGVIWRSYYFAGGARIAMREDSDQGSEV